MTSAILTHSNSRFLHLPKTGGSWIIECMENVGIDFNLIDPEKKCRGGHTGYNYKWQSGFSFSFIRNPFDWYKSLFKFNVGSNRHPDWEKEDINKFVFETIQAGYFLAEMARYFFGVNYEISFIGKYENLCEDFIEALDFAIETIPEDKIEKIREFSKTVVNGTDGVECEEYSSRTENMIYAVDSYIFRRFKY